MNMSAHHSNSTDSRPLAERMRAYGCTELIRLDEPLQRPEQIEYLDLLPQRRSSSRFGVHAVAEHQGTALLYVVDACDGAEASNLQGLQWQLANRSEPAWLGVARLGSLDLYPVGFHERATIVPLDNIREDTSTAPLFFQNLVHGSYGGNQRLQGSDYVFEKIYALLTRTIDVFVKSEKKSLVEPLDVLSMAGRVLFFRFLIDRKIVRDAELQDICPVADNLKETFADAEKAARTSAWLDETFNGDFLQLIDESIPADHRAARQDAYLQFYKRVEARAGRRFFQHLHAILNGWRAGGEVIQSELDWGDLDFAHIPVGVLSQVYESFSHRADYRAAKTSSTHYTPRNIARLMVDQTFAAVESPAAAKVLDPTCGAGIFLVLAFRQLVSQRWRRDGKRPNTRTIQKILYNQLRGFDISESALRLAALALYITAIEVNGTQRPPKSLKFPKNLRDTVLYRFGDASQGEFVLGSLGPDVPEEWNGTFDIVIGNPPWTRLREKNPQSRQIRRTKKAATERLNEEFTEIGRRVLRDRGFLGLAAAYENPDKNPDLPFIWRAVEWARPNRGLISFTLPARIFSRSTEKGRQARSALLGTVSINGLINGADLRWSNVWKGIKVPFCVLFALNAIPPPNYRFYYAAPAYEPSQNRHARFRIDYEAARPISVERVERQPWVLKTLALGTWCDVDVMERLLNAFPESLESRWKAWNPAMDKTGQGYNRSPELAQKPAEFLGSLPDFERPSAGFTIEYASLRTYLEKYGDESAKDGSAIARRPKTEELFKPPLVIIPQSPGDDPRSPKAFLSSLSLAFSQSYYGYSCAGHSAARTLAALLYITAHSDLLRYFVLMTSASQGADRMRFTKSDLDRFPFPDVSALPVAEKAKIRRLARRLEQGADKPWDEIDSLLFRLYGLDQEDTQVVHDTLFAAAAYRRQGRAALNRTTGQDRVPFRDELRDILDPYFDVCGEVARVEDAPDQPDSWEQPWFFLAISRAGIPPRISPAILRQAMEEANQRSASRILVRIPENSGLLLGILNQRRWWTVTRARLCAQHIIRHHLEAFGLAEAI